LGTLQDQNQGHTQAMSARCGQTG